MNYNFEHNCFLDIIRDVIISYENNKINNASHAVEGESVRNKIQDK